MARSEAAPKKKLDVAAWVQGFRQYVKESQQEAKKVTWPDRRQVTMATVVVLVVVTFMTFLIMGVDFVFARIFSVIFQRPLS